MRKKDYELLATRLKIERPPYEYGDSEYGLWHSIVTGLAHGLVLNDPKFSYNKFLTACGIETGESDWTKRHKNCPHYKVSGSGTCVAPSV